MPDVSVVVPIFNCAEYLETCLLSISRQTFSNFEVLCIDDLSQDGSAKIVNKFSKLDPRFRLLRHTENRGAGGARNTGILNAQGDYLAFVDSDDFIEPNTLELLVDATHDAKFDVVECGFNVVSPGGKILSSHVPTPRQHNDTASFGSCLLATNPSFWNKLWRSELFRANGILFPERLYWEDLATIPRLIAVAKNMNVIDAVCYNYFDRQESYTNAAGPKHLYDYLKVFDILLSFLKERGLYDAERKNFEELVRVNMHYHADKIHRRGFYNMHDTDRYLAYCFVLCSGYLDSLELQDSDSQQILARIRQRKRLEPEAAEVPGLPQEAVVPKPKSNLLNRLLGIR